MTDKLSKDEKEARAEARAEQRAEAKEAVAAEEAHAAQVEADKEDVSGLPDAPPQAGGFEAPPPPPPPDTSGLDDGSTPAEEEGELVTQLQPLPGTQLPIGPFNDYAFVTTPYGEFGVPKGLQIVAFKEVKDHQGKRSYKAVYEGKQYARTAEERLEWIRQTERQRIEQAEAGRV